MNISYFNIKTKIVQKPITGIIGYFAILDTRTATSHKQTVAALICQVYQGLILLVFIDARRI